jgi:hypothetical protein
VAAPESAESAIGTSTAGRSGSSNAPSPRGATPTRSKGSKCSKCCKLELQFRAPKLEAEVRCSGADAAVAVTVAVVRRLRDQHPPAGGRPALRERVVGPQDSSARSLRPLRRAKRAAATLASHESRVATGAQHFDGGSVTESKPASDCHWQCQGCTCTICELYTNSLGGSPSRGTDDSKSKTNAGCWM